MKYVLVVWGDACSNDAWTELEGAKEYGLAEIHTVGHLVDANDERVVVALSKNMDTEAVSNFIAIPRAWVRDMRELKLPRARKPKAITS